MGVGTVSGQRDRWKQEKRVRDGVGRQEGDKSRPREKPEKLRD